MKRLFAYLCTFICIVIPAKSQKLERVAPEQVGMDSKQLQYTDKLIENAISNEEIPGAVLAVVRQGKMAYLKAYGNKRVYPYKEEMTVETLFDIASCSKSVSTAICTMILVERGKIRLGDAVKFYIPNFADWRDEEKNESTSIRVVDLLTHTSGLPPYAPVAQLEEDYGSPNPKGLMDYISECKRDFKPKTDFQYSCLNFITLQHIIEQISGESLRDFAKKNIFDVLGMRHTDYFPCKRNYAGKWTNTTNSFAEGLTRKEAQQLIAPTEKQKNGQVLCGQVHDPLARVLNGGISGNAGVFSCAEDLAILCAALQNGGVWHGKRVLSPQGVKTMRTVPATLTTWGRALGWDSHSAYASNNGDLLSAFSYGHTGYTGPFITIDPENDLSIIFLTNAVHPIDEHNVVRLRALIANTVAAAIMPLAAQRTEHYYKRFVQFMYEKPIDRDDIVMLGNSLTENGGDWSRLLKKKRVINRGIIGDDIRGICDRLHQILPGHPAKIFFLAGINDISHGQSPAEIATCIAKTIDQIQLESPSTTIYLQSLLPINEDFKRYKLLDGKTEAVMELNERLKLVAKEKKIEFVDLFPLFVEKGTFTLRKNLTEDGLHLNEKGYKIWAKALKPYL